MKKIILLLLVIGGLTQQSVSQDQHLIDSLQNQLKKLNATKLELGKYAPTMNDTMTANILYQLYLAYLYYNPDKSMAYARQTLALSEQIDYKKGIGGGYNAMGCLNLMKGENLPALEFFRKSLTIRQEINDRQGISGSFTNIGLVYRNMGNCPEALKCYFSSLKIDEENGDKKGIANSYHTIGVIYIMQGEYPQALKYENAALKIREEIGDKRAIANTYNSIGAIYYNQDKYPDALKCYFSSLKIYEEIGVKRGIADNYNNIGVTYSVQGHYPDALKYFFNALKLAEELGHKDIMAALQGNIGLIYTRQKKYTEASLYLNKALLLSKEINDLENIRQNYFQLSELDSSRGDYKQALVYYKMHIKIRDSLVNKEKTKKIVQQQMQYDFDKKETLAKAGQEKKDIRQRNIRYTMTAGLAGLIIFLMVAYWQRNKISKAKKISEEERMKAEAEKKRSEELLLNILPYEVAEELKSTGTARAKTFSMVSVMFTDFKDFTRVSEKVSAELLVDELHYCFSAFDKILEKHKIEKIKTIGDSYMCASGLPVLNYTHAVDLVNAAMEIRDFILERKKEKETKGEIPFELRIGIHTGPVVAGIVGIKKFAYDIWGDTVNIAARMEQNSEAGKINISGSTYQLVKDKFSCVYRGKIEAKNKGEVEMYFVE